MSDHSIETISAIVMGRLQKLSPHLTYHSLSHTEDVVSQAIRIGLEEGLNDAEMFLLKVAALYHDTGFLRTYANHEKFSAEIFLEDAVQFRLTEPECKEVVRLIMVTQIPQRPLSLMEKVICDADLDYLGREDFFSIGELLRKEFLHYRIVSNNEEWEKMQLKFLQGHNYHTASSRKKREPVKQQHYSALF